MTELENEGLIIAALYLGLEKGWLDLNEIGADPSTREVLSEIDPSIPDHAYELLGKVVNDVRSSIRNLLRNTVVFGITRNCFSDDDLISPESLFAALRDISDIPEYAFAMIDEVSDLVTLG